MKKEKEEKYKYIVIERSSLQKLVNEIATDLLTIYSNPDNIECTRAQMMLKQSDGSEKNMGGRNKNSIQQTIYSHLDNY
jgi:hypothetical protein